MKHLRADKASESFDRLVAEQLDVTGAEYVRVVVHDVRKTLHVNVNGVCLLRICNIKGYTIEHIVGAKP